MRTILLLVSMTLFLHSGEADVIIKRLEDNLRGKNAYAKIEMAVQTKRHSRTMVIESWSEGKKKNFTKILSPSRDAGITFLSLGNQMWQYIPKIERTIKIPPSMMLQSWMGTDFTNDDMVKQSSISDDYNARIVDKKGSIVTVELTPKASAAVVWGKIVSKVDTRTYTQIEDVFYDDRGEKVRLMRYSGVRQYDGHFVTTTMVMTPLDPVKQGNRTTIRVKDMQFDRGVDSSYFTKSALKRYSI